MVRFAVILLLALFLTACAIDPCSIDQNSPTCDTRRSEARATIGAIDADAALRATQSAIYLAEQGTKAAISVKATKQVVQAEATQAALNTEATRQAIASVSTQSAVIYRSTQTWVDAEATRIAVNVSGAIERANTERAAVPYNAVFNVIVFWFLIPACLVLAVLIYGRRTVQRTTEAITQQLHKRAAMITYGPPNNPQLAFVTFDARTGQPTRLLTTEGLIGNHLELDSGETAISRLKISDPLKLAALVEANKRSQAARIAASTGRAPWSAAAVYDTAPDPSITAPPAATNSLPQIPTFAELLRNWRPTPDRIMFGLDEAIQPLYGRLDQLLSVIIVGRQGTGKTNLLRFIYAQCLIVGAEVKAWDIHEDIIDDLPGAQACTSALDIDLSATGTIAELDRRIREGEKRAARPLMVLIDEMNSLTFAVPTIVDAVRRIVTEGRKYNVYCVVSCKGAPADEFGKSYVRDAFSAHYAFNTTTRQAALIGFDREEVEPVRRLERGQALLEGPVSTRTVRIPLVLPDEIKTLLPASFAENEPLRPASATSGEVAQPVFRSGSEAAGEVDPKRLKVLEMLRARASQNEIIKSVYGASGGEKYQRAAAEIRQIIQESIP